MSVLGFLALLSALGLAVVWVVYPAAVGVAGLLRRRLPGAVETALPKVSVVIATREPAAAVHDRVRDCVGAAYPRELLEMVVAYDAAAGAPDADLLAEVCGDVAVRLVAADSPGGKAAALNAGVRAASGDVLVFADTYQRFDERAIGRLAKAVLAPGVGGATGRYHLAPGAGPLVTLYWGFERWLRRAEAGVHSSVGATGAAWAMRRALWSPLPAGLILDDVYTPMRIVLAGQRVVFVDDAGAFETRRLEPAQEYSRKVRTLTGVIQLCAWLPDLLKPGRNPIWMQFVLHKLMRLLTPYWVLILSLWALVASGSVLGGAALAWAGAAVLLLFGWLALARDRWGSSVRRVAVEGVLLQLAVLMAGINGLRGDWQVWDG